jgi:hypothetical protein
MISVARILSVVALMVAICAAVAQTPVSMTSNNPASGAVKSDESLAPKSDSMTTKDTPAARRLKELSKKFTDETRVVNNEVEQVRFQFVQQSRAINDQIAQTQKELHDKEMQDKKLKPLVDRIDQLNSQKSTLLGQMQRQFTQSAGSMVHQVDAEKAEIDGLISIVKQENDWPDNSRYDISTGKWTVNPPASSEPKK